MNPVIRRDARAERIEAIKCALVLIAFCALLLVALWPDSKERRDPYTTIPESGITGGTKE